MPYLKPGAILVAAMFVSACQSDDPVCSSSALTTTSRVSQAECSCKLAAADKYLSGGDRAYLIQYWSGERNDQPHIYLGNAYRTGDRKPLIKYNAYVAKECRG